VVLEVGKIDLFDIYFYVVIAVVLDNEYHIGFKMGVLKKPLRF
jgi:hypothetical protein